MWPNLSQFANLGPKVGQMWPTPVEVPRLVGPPPSPRGVPLQSARTLARVSVAAHGTGTPHGRWARLTHCGIRRRLKARLTSRGRETPFLIGHWVAQVGPGAGRNSLLGVRAPSGPPLWRDVHDVGAPRHPERLAPWHAGGAQIKSCSKHAPSTALPSTHRPTSFDQNPTQVALSVAQTWWVSTQLWVTLAGRRIDVIPDMFRDILIGQVWSGL